MRNTLFKSVSVICFGALLSFIVQTVFGSFLQELGVQPEGWGATLANWWLGLTSVGGFGVLIGGAVGLFVGVLADRFADRWDRRKEADESREIKELGGVCAALAARIKGRGYFSVEELPDYSMMNATAKLSMTRLEALGLDVGELSDLELAQAPERFSSVLGYCAGYLRQGEVQALRDDLLRRDIGSLTEKHS